MLSAFRAGQLSEIVGHWSSGAGSLLLALLARTTAAGDYVAVVDGADAFDPAAAVAAGADLGKLLWVKCGGRPREAFGAADLLVRCPGFALVVLDLGDPSLIRRERIPPAFWRRLKIAGEQSHAMLVLRAPQSVAGSAAALALSVRRRESRWVGTARPTRFAGFSSEVRILRCHPRPLSLAREHVIAWWL